MAAVAENGHAVTDENAAPAVAASSDEAITVFHNPENFNVKHPLMHEWTLWFTKPPSGKVRIASGIGGPGESSADFPPHLGRQLE